MNGDQAIELVRHYIQQAYISEFKEITPKHAVLETLNALLANLESGLTLEEIIEELEG